MGQKKKFNYVDFILKYLSVILMIIALIYIGVNNHYFFKVNNIISILLQTASLAIMAMGMTFVLITGGIDLSIPPVMALGAILGTLYMQHGGNGFIALDIESVYCLLLILYHESVIFFKRLFFLN